MYLITSNCNLRCYGCVQNCDKFQSETYVELNTFKKHLKILKQALPHMTNLCLIGGEPLLHKQLIELCKVAYEELNPLPINIYTNGILLNTLKDQDLINLYQKYNITFYISLYPKHEYINIYKKQIARLDKLNIPYKWQMSHVFFTKYSLNKFPSSLEFSKELFKGCLHEMIEDVSFLIKDEYLYLCCPSISVIQHNLVNPENNTGTIQLNNLKSEEQIEKLLTTPFETCKYCAINTFYKEGRQLMYWHEGKEFNYNIDSFMPLSEIYLNHYEEYEKLTSQNYDLCVYLKDPFFFENIKNETPQNEFNSLLNRYYDGLLDIFIPFSKNSSINNLKDLLIKQKYIEKFNIYFISIDDDKDSQKKWFKEFAPYKTNNLNTYFLKGKNLYQGCKKFYENSSIINKYFFDVSNLSALENPNFLFNLIKEKK